MNSDMTGNKGSNHSTAHKETLIHLRYLKATVEAQCHNPAQGWTKICKSGNENTFF